MPSPDHDRARAPSANTTAPKTRRCALRAPGWPRSKGPTGAACGHDDQERAPPPSASTTRTRDPGAVPFERLARHRSPGPTGAACRPLTRTGRARRRPTPPRQRPRRCALRAPGWRRSPGPTGAACGPKPTTGHACRRPTPPRQRPRSCALRAFAGARRAAGDVCRRGELAHSSGMSRNAVSRSCAVRFPSSFRSLPNN